MGCILIDQRSHDCADGAVNVTISPNNEVIGVGVTVTDTGAIKTSSYLLKLGNYFPNAICNSYWLIIQELAIVNLIHRYQVTEIFQKQSMHS